MQMNSFSAHVACHACQHARQSLSAFLITSFRTALISLNMNMSCGMHTVACG